MSGTRTHSSLGDETIGFIIYDADPDAAAQSLDGSDVLVGEEQ